PQEHDDDDGRHLQAGAGRREPRSRADRQRAEHLPHQDEIFVRIQYVAVSDYWILTTKDGTQHRFGYNTDSKAMTRGQDLTTAITYKYFLDQATTTGGVAVRYTYTKQTGTIASNGQT